MTLQCNRCNRVSVMLDYARCCVLPCPVPSTMTCCGMVCYDVWRIGNASHVMTRVVTICFANV
eukprot:3431702-Pyramimonas_sp.AAC.1